ncbi:AsmA family protein [Candidiatus Paracoxiella cheracis]|uniref:AsmA family protein n=1 Tax=Candidiatus Paracoxiella cheracis TaxID=3405120 RepID=UPI003BF584FE
MRTAIKFISGIIILLVILFIITIIVLTKIVNPNEYRHHIDNYVFQKTGRHLTIGKVGWSFVPWLGVDLKNIQLTNSTGFKGPNLASIGEIKVKVRFWPLITGKVHFGKIVVDNATISLITNATGQQNWSDWSKAATTKPQASKTVATKSNSNSKVSIPQVQIAGISITRSFVNIINEKTKTKTALTNFNFTTGGIDNTKNFPAHVSFTEQQSNTKTVVLLSANAVANLDTQQQIYQLRHVTINIEQRRSNLPTLHSSLLGKMVINLPKQTLTFSPFTAQIANMKMNGQLRINHLFQTPQIMANVSSRGTELQPFMNALLGKSALKGTLSFNSAITTSGSSKKALIANLNGKGNMAIANGAVTGFNLNDLLAAGDAIVHQQPVPQGNAPKLTPFSDLSGSYVIKRGVLTNNDLRLIAGQAGAQGAGVLNLNNNAINYVLTAQYQTKSGSKPSFELPIRVQGSLPHPSIQPDYSSIAKQVLTNAIEKKIKNYAGQAGGKLNLNKLFKGL